MFEYLENGSLDTFLTGDGDRRSLLSGHCRVQIMYEVIRSLHFLHGGGASGFTFFHRDIKSGNICLDKSFTAKIIDCGLAKLVVDEQELKKGHVLGSVRRSLITSSESVVFGTEGYICNWYLRTKSYIAACDVFSFGVVMIELITGCLQNGQSGADRTLGDFLDRYEEEPAKLRSKDVDSMAGESWDLVLDDLCELALKCTSEKRNERPSTKSLMESLTSFLARMQGRHNTIGHGEHPGNPPPSGVMQCCALCGCPSKLGTLCSEGHFMDPNCMEEHVVKCLMNHKQQNLDVCCPIDGCSCRSLQVDKLYGVVSPSTFVLLLELRKGKDSRLDQVVAMMNNLSIRNAGSQDVEILKVMCQLAEKVTIMGNRVMQGLAMVGTGRTMPCPRLVWITPCTAGSTNGGGWFPRTFLQKDIKVWFICEHSFTAVHPPLEFTAKRDWIKKVAPALKVCAILLRFALLAGKLAVGLPFPVPMGGDIEVQLDSFDQFVEDVLGDRDLAEELNVLGETHAEGHCLDDARRHRISEITGSAYQVLAEKATKDKRAEWMAVMTPVLDSKGSSVRYVKNEYLKDYLEDGWGDLSPQGALTRT